MSNSSQKPPKVVVLAVNGGGMAIAAMAVLAQQRSKPGDNVLPGGFSDGFGYSSQDSLRRERQEELQQSLTFPQLKR